MSGTDAPSVARRAEDNTDTKPPPSDACPRRQRRGCENGRGNRAKLQIEHSFRVKVYLEMVIHDIRLAWICGENLQRGGGVELNQATTALQVVILFQRARLSSLVEFRYSRLY